MSDNNNSIHDFDFNLICEYFSNVDRQGPGSEEATIKALSFIENLPDQAQIADLGCGTGGQTMVLATHTKGTITAIDLFPLFIDILNENAKARGLNKRVKGIVGSMESLPFENEQLDLIWAEGSIYNIGFERGLTEWRKFLKPGGYLAVTEAAWFTDERPTEIEAFWNDGYPLINTIPNQVAQIQKAGYIIAASFIIPENCWSEHFFKPQEAVQENFLIKHPDNHAAKDLVANMRHEAYLYEKYKEYYGYVFYIARKLKDQ